MSTLSIRLPDDLKHKAMRLAKKKNMSFNGLVNRWLQAAVTQDETIEWMKKRLQGKDSKLRHAEFGRFLEKTKPGEEPTLKEIQERLGE